MPDPALKKSLSPDDIENLTKAADFQLVRKTTPGLTPLSGADKWFIWGVILVISGVLYVNSRHGSESWIVRLTLLVQVRVKAGGHQVHRGRLAERDYSQPVCRA